MQTFIPLSEIGATNTSMASIKLSSADSINVRSQQVRPILLQSYFPSSTPSHQMSTSSIPQSNLVTGFIAHSNFTDNNNSKSLSAIPEAVFEVPDATPNSQPLPGMVTEHVSNRKPTTLRFQMSNDQYTPRTFRHEFVPMSIPSNGGNGGIALATGRPFVDFNLNSVGRSFIDEIDETLATISLNTPETPTPNISPSSSNRFSESFSNDFQPKAPSTPSIVVSPIQETTKLTIPNANFCGSWDLLELDLNFHDVNFDPSFGGDLEECIYFGDDPLGLLPHFPTAPDAFDL